MLTYSGSSCPTGFAAYQTGTATGTSPCYSNCGAWTSPTCTHLFSLLRCRILTIVCVEKGSRLTAPEEGYGLKYGNGRVCGGVAGSFLIKFVCGPTLIPPTTPYMTVSENGQCQYEVTFPTTLGCTASAPTPPPREDCFQGDIYSYSDCTGNRTPISGNLDACTQGPSFNYIVSKGSGGYPEVDILTYGKSDAYCEQNPLNYLYATIGECSPAGYGESIVISEYVDCAAGDSGSAGVIAGIAVGTFAAAAVVLGGGYWYNVRHRRTSSAATGGKSLTEHLIVA